MEAYPQFLVGDFRVCWHMLQVWAEVFIMTTGLFSQASC